MATTTTITTEVYEEEPKQRGKDSPSASMEFRVYPANLKGDAAKEQTCKDRLKPGHDCAWGYIFLVVFLVYMVGGSILFVRDIAQQQKRLNTGIKGVQGLIQITNLMRPPPEGSGFDPTDATDWAKFAKFCMCSDTPSVANKLFPGDANKVTQDIFTNCLNELQNFQLDVSKISLFDSRTWLKSIQSCETIVTVMQSVPNCVEGSDFPTLPTDAKINEMCEAGLQANGAPPDLWSQIIGALMLGALIVALLCFVESVLWILALKTCAHVIVKCSIIVGMLLSVLSFIMSWSTGPIAIITGIFLIIRIVWYIVMRHVIDFCAQMISESAGVALSRPGPMLVTLTLGTVYQLVNVVALSGWSKAFPGVGVIVGVLCHLWTYEVGKNVMHVANIRIVGAWFYGIGGPSPQQEPKPDEAEASAYPEGAVAVNPDGTEELKTVVANLDGEKGSWAPHEVNVNICTELAVACTHLFGSIAAGSFLMACLGWLVYLVRKHAQMTNKCLQLMLLCIVCCVKKCLAQFTGALYVRVGLFGMSYLASAKDTLHFTTVGRGGGAAILDQLVIDDVFERLVSIASALGGQSGSIAGGISAVTFLIPLMNTNGACNGVDNNFFGCFFNFPGFFIVALTFLVGMVLGWHIGRVMLAQATALVESTLQCLLFFWYTEREYFGDAHPEMFGRIKVFQDRRDEQLRKIKQCCGCGPKPVSTTTTTIVEETGSTSLVAHEVPPAGGATVKVEVAEAHVLEATPPPVALSAHEQAHAAAVAAASGPQL